MLRGVQSTPANPPHLLRIVNAETGHHAAEKFVPTVNFLRFLALPLQFPENNDKLLFVALPPQTVHKG